MTCHLGEFVSDMLPWFVIQGLDTAGASSTGELFWLPMNHTCVPWQNATATRLYMTEGEKNHPYICTKFMACIADRMHSQSRVCSAKPRGSKDNHETVCQKSQMVYRPQMQVRTHGLNTRTCGQERPKSVGYQYSRSNGPTQHTVDVIFDQSSPTVPRNHLPSHGSPLPSMRCRSSFQAHSHIHCPPPHRNNLLR